MRRLLISTLAALGAFGGVAFAMQTLSGGMKPESFTLSVAPVKQSVTRGNVAGLTVNVKRAKDFRGATTLRVAGLPRGMRARWRLADGTPSRVVPSGETGAILKLRTTRRTPLGTRRYKLIARGGGTSVSRRLLLTIVRPRRRFFSLSVSPSRQSITQGSASLRFEVHVARAAGFRRPVMLRALRVPRGATGKWSGSTLSITTSSGIAPGAHRLVIRGASVIQGRLIRRFAVISLVVTKSPEAHAFGIGGDHTRLLYPGASDPLDLVLTNPHSFDLRVTSLSVNLRARTTKPGCSGTANYAVAQYRGGLPLVLPPGTSRLGALGRPSSTWPRVTMLNLPVNQDACRGAVLTLDFSGTAVR